MAESTETEDQPTTEMPEPIADETSEAFSPTKTFEAEVIPTKSVTDEEQSGSVIESEDQQVTDIFAWTNNLVQYVEDLKIELFLINKNYVLYKASLGGTATKQLRPLFIDEILEYVLGGIDKGLMVRSFEAAESEENVLQFTKAAKIDSLSQVINWLKTQEHEIEQFVEEEHDLKRIKGVIARCSHPKIGKPFYILKSMPMGQILKGASAWMFRDGKFEPFNAYSAFKIPSDNQLLLIGNDLFVFSQPKLKALFGYDAKEASIAEKKIKEIEQHFKFAIADGMTLQQLLKGKKAIAKKLQKIDPARIPQDDLVDHGDEMGLEMMLDDSGAIIIMDDKDLAKFVNLLNDDYIESPLTGIRYEIQKKRELKPPSDDDMLKVAQNLKG